MNIKAFTLVLIFCVAVSAASYSQTQKGKATGRSSAKSVPKTSPSVNKTSAGKTLADKPVTNANPALKLLSAREKELLDEINFARANPAEYLKALEAFRKNYRGREIHYPEGRVLVTNEGVEALDDAIKFLREQKPLAPLDLRKGMIQAARVHANDLVSTNKSGHRGSDGSQPGERMDRFGKWDDSYGENIVYDARTPRYDLIGMIIDDGTSNRGHRKNLFKKDFRVIGIAIGIRSNASSLGVVTFAGGMAER